MQTSIPPSLQYLEETEPLMSLSLATKQPVFKQGTYIMTGQGFQPTPMGHHASMVSKNISRILRQWKLLSQLSNADSLVAGPDGTMSFITAPAQTSWDAERLDAFLLGTDNALYQITWTKSGGWQAIARLGGNWSTFVPAAVSVSNFWGAPFFIVTGVSECPKIPRHSHTSFYSMPSNTQKMLTYCCSGEKTESTFLSSIPTPKNSTTHSSTMEAGSRLQQASKV